jgi:4'-phosphopantetheinyl transferase EntD
MVVLYPRALAAATGLRQAAFFAGQACANADEPPASLGLENPRPHPTRQPLVPPRRSNVRT